jgi:hypothetical protein
MSTTSVQFETSTFLKGSSFFYNVERYPQGLRFYSRRFEHCYAEKFVTVASPETFLCPERVHSAYSSVIDAHTAVVADLKIIVTLREPVARELSWYNRKVSEFYLNSILIPKEDLIIPESSFPKDFEEYATDLALSLKSNSEGPS